MTPETLLLRQINKVYVSGEQPAYLAFRPQTKDNFLLSVDNGDMIEAYDSWKRFVSNPRCHSVGVLAVMYSECENENLPVIEDRQPYPEHCSIDFSGLDRKIINSKSKLLWDKASKRGWLYRQPE